MGNLILPKEIVKKASENSILIDYRTPRELVLKAIELTYPGILRKNIHVWTLRGAGRVSRIGELWAEWQKLGVHLVEDGWILPSGLSAFTESGTYAPTYRIGKWNDESGAVHLFICDGYAASAEALQAASLAPLLGLEASLSVFTSRFALPYFRERQIMGLNPDAPDFVESLSKLTGEHFKPETPGEYKKMIMEAKRAGLPLQKPTLQADDFFPEKNWDILAVNGYMQPDPYTGFPGVEMVEDHIYRVAVRLTGMGGDKLIILTLRLMETFEQSKLVFNPLLIRFLGGENFRTRPVKISDSGRIRNELQTLCSEALDFLEDERIRVHFNRIPPDVISPEHQEKLYEVLQWYKQRHPIWFSWLEIGE